MVSCKSILVFRKVDCVLPETVKRGRYLSLALLPIFKSFVFRISLTWKHLGNRGIGVGLGWLRPWGICVILLSFLQVNGLNTKVEIKNICIGWYHWKRWQRHNYAKQRQLVLPSLEWVACHGQCVARRPHQWHSVDHQRHFKDKPVWWVVIGGSLAKYVWLPKSERDRSFSVVFPPLPGLFPWRPPWPMLMWRSLT